MNKSVSRNYFNYLPILVLSAIQFLSPLALKCQDYLKAELRTTNCPVSRHQADRWLFGQAAGLDFRPDIPVADPTTSQMDVNTSPAVMADSNGNILFYTDGRRVFDRNGSIMPHGDGLHSAGSTMPVIIIPKPESDSIYYIFTTFRPKSKPDDPITIYGLEYNELSLKRNNGLGDITRGNIELLPPDVASKLTAVRHSNGVDYWVVGHRYDSLDVNRSKEFCAFRVTRDGVDSNYVSSVAGTAQGGFQTTKNLGYMKISPDGTKLATAIHGLGIYEIFNFDASTGKVSNAITSSPAFTNAYGIEFSPDSRFLYATTTSASGPSGLDIPISYLFQFDINSGGSIFSSFDTIAVDTLGSYFAGIQLGTDGKIYVCRYPLGNASLSVIENPKRLGTACNFKVNAADLAGKLCRNGLPNFIQSYFNLPHFDVENVCFTDTALFSLQDNSNVDNVTWQFGDPGSGSNTSTSIQGSHIFSGPGSYTVQVTETFNGQSYGPYTETVIVNDLPAVIMDDTVYMYPGSPIILDAGAGYSSYYWSTEETSQKVTINAIGTYWVRVQNEKCCFKTDTAVVIYFDVIVPNAFRPGGANNIFKAYASSLDAVQNFSLYVFNRWGQELYVTGDITQGWDGTINGKPAPGDVYVWLVNYDVQRKGKTERIAYKGNVILLR
jgi:gliding motility-associated-like protein